MVDIFEGIGIGTLALVILKYFIDYFSNKKLENIQSEHQIELETLKIKLAEQSKSNERISSAQYETYQELWENLIDISNAANNLWTMASVKNLDAFYKLVQKLKPEIQKKLLIIESEHNILLMKIIKGFEKFYYGKSDLIDLRKRGKNVEIFQIQDAIETNRRIKERFDTLLISIQRSLFDHIRNIE